MIDPITVINCVFGGLAIVFGLSSRRLLTALKAGLLVGLLHVGLVLLAFGQSGTISFYEPAEVRPLLDRAVQLLETAASGYVVVPQPRFVVYLAASLVVLTLVTLVTYVIKWLLVSMLALIRPRKAIA
jgi:hypothetical protein